MTDSGPQKLFDIELMTTGGTRQFDTNNIIARYNTDMLRTVLADVLAARVRVRSSRGTLWVAATRTPSRGSTSNEPRPFLAERATKSSPTVR
jgi:hypothetical protein